MKTCRKCEAELVVGENWYISYAKHGDYICKRCKKACDHKYRAENPEKVAASQRQWRKDNPNHDRRYREEHREERAAYNRQYQQEHEEEIAAYKRQYVQENLEKSRAACHRRRARKQNAIIGEIDEAAIYELYNDICVYCGASEDLTIDHVVALNGGGPHCQENLVVACRSCNCSKGAKPLEDWLQTQPRALAWVM